MGLSKIVNVWDYHTAGHPLRLISGGLPRLKGRNMVERMDYMKQHYDWIRTSCLMLPRGNPDLVGAVLVEPSDPTCDIGVFYIDAEFYQAMCGAGTMAVSTACVELGLVEKKEPITEVRLDTPAGVVTTYVEVKNGEVQGVSLRSVESFMLKHNCSIDYGKYGEIQFDIMYGGHYFVLIDAKQFKGLEVNVKNAKRWAEIGNDFRKKAMEKYSAELMHPENEELTKLFQDIGIECAMIYPEAYEEDGKMIYPNILVFGKNSIDYSPCGTGTTGRLAVRYTLGELAMNEEFYHESVIGTRFIGKVIGAREVNGITMCQTEVKGRSHLVSVASLIVDDKDPLKEGFSLE